MPFLARAAVALAVSLSMGCVTTGLGRPPADVDLANDGSPAAKAALLDSYSLAYRDRMVQRPGADPAAIGVDRVAVPAVSEEAIGYLGSSELAGAELETGAVAVDRFVTDGSLNMLIYAASAALGASIAVAVTAPSVIASLQETEPNPNVLGDVAWAGFFGAATGLLAAVPIVFVSNWTLTPLVNVAADGDYRRAVRTYNRELTERIERGGPEAPAPAPQAAPKAAPPAGPPVPPPAPTPMEVEEPAPEPVEVEVEEELAPQADEDDDQAAPEAS